MCARACVRVGVRARVCAKLLVGYITAVIDVENGCYMVYLGENN